LYNYTTLIAAAAAAADAAADVNRLGVVRQTGASTQMSAADTSQQSISGARYGQR